MRQLIVAVQISCTDQVGANPDKLRNHVREAALCGAGLAVLQELFEGVYLHG